MRSIKYVLMACTTAAIVGCSTTNENRDAVGRSPGEPGYYEGSRGSTVDGLNRGVNTNYFGPVNAGAEAARGPGTPSGKYDYR
jgi:hypothetical protein